jgi:SAM-dependent methyltransferase
MGAHQLRRGFVDDFVKPFVGMTVLDIGCGPADILAYLDDVDYVGFDISQSYITQARRKFKNKGRFHCKYLETSDLNDVKPVDVVLALGVLHHLDDKTAVEVIQLALKALKPGGRLLTMDPCIDPMQNPIARFLALLDRGQNVRNKAGYESLVNKVFESFRVEVRHRAWIPYTHCFMECQKRAV